MMKYKILLLDDEIFHVEERHFVFEAFLEDKWLNYYRMKAKEDGLDVSDETLYKAIEPHANSGYEFEVLYHERLDEESLRSIVTNNEFDAIFLDVSFDNALEKTDFFKVLSALERYMIKGVPPVFVYSGKLNDDMVLSINEAFDRVFVGRGPDRLYIFKEIKNICDSAHKRKEGGQCDFGKLIAARQRISNIISKTKDLATFFPKKRDEISILHISDLQFGDKHSSNALNGILNSISSKVGNIDLLVITGDIAMHGWTSEFNEAEAFITQLRDKLWPKDINLEEKCRRTIIVPGNHDVDLNILATNYFDAKPIENVEEGNRTIDFENLKEQLSSPVLHQHDSYQRLALQAFRDFAYNVTRDSHYYLCDTLNFVNDRFINWGIRFLCLNSVGAISAIEANKVFLVPESDRFHSLESVMSIALCHHTLLCENPGEISNGDAELFRKTLLGYITGNRCQILMGGHRHTSASKIESTENSADYLVCETASLRLEGTDDKHIRSLKKYVLHRQDDKFTLLDEILYKFSDTDASITDGEIIQNKTKIPKY